MKYLTGCSALIDDTNLTKLFNIYYTCMNRVISQRRGLFSRYVAVIVVSHFGI